MTTLSRYALALCLSAAALQTAAQQPEGMQAQHQHTGQAGTAATGQEQKEVQARHRQQTTEGAAPAVSRGAGHGAGKGGQKHGAGTPAGNKNKAHKSGK